MRVALDHPRDDGQRDVSASCTFLHSAMSNAYVRNRESDYRAGVLALQRFASQPPCVHPSPEGATWVL
jgi:hypothetical protein